MASRLGSASTQISDYQDIINDDEGSYEDELATLYDDTSEELNNIRPISAPSQASFFDDYPESIGQDYDGFNDYDSIDLLSENYSYAEPLSYNFVYNEQPRTVPPFYDSTTNRDTYTWKYTIPERFNNYEEQYGVQSELPEFQDQTTNQATYQNFEFLPSSRSSSYGSVVREVPRFEGQTTHRESYTPKTIQKLVLTPSIYSSKRVQPPPFDNLTTNQRDFIKQTTEHVKTVPPPPDNLKVGGRPITSIKSTNRTDFVELKNGCPAEKALRSGLRNAKHKDGHYFFATRSQRENAATRLKRRSKSSGSSKKLKH